MQEPPSNAAGVGQIPLVEQAYNQHSAPSLGQQQEYGASSQNLRSASEGCYLWIGDLQPWMDEDYLMNFFRKNSEARSARVVRNMHTGQAEGHGFVEFINHSVAESVLQKYNGAQMPNCEQTFRLNWAQTFYNIYVGDLAPEVTDSMLMKTFKDVYTSVQGAYVVIDMITGCKKDYGFVRFGDENEQMRAMSEMNGKYCSTRRMRIAPAKKRLTMLPATHQNSQGGNLGEGDTNNRTIFVGSLDASVTDDELKSYFYPLGEIDDVKRLPGKHCGFVKFANRNSAEAALLLLNGARLGGQKICLSWGRYKQHDQAQWNGGRYHGYPPQPRGYNSQYGFAPHPPPPPQPRGYNEPYGYAPHPPPPPQPHGYNEPFGYASNPPPPQPYGYNEPYGYACNPPPPQPHGYNEPYGYASHPPPQNPNPYYGGYTDYVNYQQQQQVNDMPQQVLVRKREESKETSVISKKRRLR